MKAAINPARHSLVVVIAAVAGLLGLIAWVSSIGGPHGPSAGLVSVAYMVIVAGPPVLAYVLGAIGLGTLFKGATRGSRDAAAIQSALGLGLMLSLSHALGVAGLLAGVLGIVLGGGIVLLGIVLLARRMLAHIRSSGGIVTGTIPWMSLLGLPALAVLITAACSPPGWLWDSEHRGYDALSYHLQLPQEWLEAGRIWPREHNVYSYLPGYVESAFYHIGAMTGAPVTGRERSLPMGLLSAEGHGVISCQLLHAGLAVFAAILVGRMAAARGGREVGALVGALFLSIPWVIVTGSLGYNEMGVAALFAGAMIVAGDVRLGNLRRGVLSGLLVGLACGCKPTALFLCAPVVGLVLVANGGKRGAVTVAWAALGGAVAIAPWIVRNWAACGNPVFPMGTGLFGNGGWTAEQVQRYVAGHRFDGSLGARLGVLFDSGSPQEPPRGLLHPQWAVLPAVALIAWVVAMIRRPTRVGALVLGAGILSQFAAWLLFTHLQSRFLLPVAVPACGLVGLGLVAILKIEVHSLFRGRTRTDAAALGAGALVCIGHAGMATGVFSGQSGGKPNLSVLQSPWFRTGELDRRVLMQDPGRAGELADAASPEIFVNVLTAPGTKVYLLGDGAPLYYTCPVLYNTTWDKWPLGEAIRRWPGQPEAWTRALMDSGVRLVLVNAAEIERLQRSGTGVAGGTIKLGWADPLVTNEAVTVWLKGEGQLVRSWPEIGVALFELKPPGAPR